MNLRKIGTGVAVGTGTGLLMGGVAVLVIVAVVAGPWLLFWSVGVMTGFVIPFTFKTWLAALVFVALVRGGGGGK